MKPDHRRFYWLSWVLLAALLAFGAHLIDPLSRGLVYGLPDRTPRSLIVPSVWVITALLGSAVAIWLLKWAGRYSEIRIVIIFLLASALFHLAVVAVFLDDNVYNTALMDLIFLPAALSAPWFALAAFVRFSAVFPVPLKDDDPSALTSVPATTRKANLPFKLVRSGFLRLRRASRSPAVPWITAAILSLLPTPAFHPKYEFEWPTWLNLWMTAMLPIFIVVFGLGLFIGVYNLRTGYRFSGDPVHRGNRGVSAAFQITGILLGTGLAILLVSGVLEGKTGLIKQMGYVSAVLIAFAFPAAVWSLAAMVLVRGAFTSASVLRRTALLGLGVVVVLVCIDKVAERLIEIAVLNLGFQPGAETIVTPGLVLLAYGHVRGSLEQWVRRHAAAADSYRPWFVLASDLVGSEDLFTRDDQTAIRVMESYHAAGREAAAPYPARMAAFGNRMIIPFDDGECALDACLVLPRCFAMETAKHGLPTPALRIVLDRGPIQITPSSGTQGMGVLSAMRLLARARPNETLISVNALGMLREHPGVRLEPPVSADLDEEAKRVVTFPPH